MEPGDEEHIRPELQQRDALMMLLIAQANGQIQRLALLAGTEKVAIAKLMAIGQAMSIYLRSTSPDAQVISSYLHVLESFSPLLRELAILPAAESDTASVISSLRETLANVTLTSEDNRVQTGALRPLPLR